MIGSHRELIREIHKQLKILTTIWQEEETLEATDQSHGME